MRLVYPFGPPIGQMMVPRHHIDSINQYTESISIKKEQEKYDHGFRLVGTAKESVTVVKGTTNEQYYDDFVGFLDTSVKSYFSKAFRRHGVVVGDRAKDFINPYDWDIWIVRQYQGEYNPMHTHSNYDISGVIYSSIPKSMSEDRPYREKGSRDGTIDFMFGSQGFLCEGKYGVRPKDGLMLIFPSYLIHTVYPFAENNSERRCLSFNVKISFCE